MVLTRFTSRTSPNAARTWRRCPTKKGTDILRFTVERSRCWIIGLDERGDPVYTDFDFNADCCLVLGSEGTGLHDLVKRSCDFLLSIPMAGSVSSLNVSVAGAVVMYEAMRQRRAGGPAPDSGRKASKQGRPQKGLGS